ncbi:MAG: von Willebrand factor type A domain-containing protein [Pirellulaceae bacterium]|nr:von Willebrand factor type A domain-containing protein [Pirellulaceae bacterium]
MSDAYNGSIDTELQVRLMNLVMGEASDFERDQLQLLMEQRAEVAAYYQHLERLHGLLCEVGAGDPTINMDPACPSEDWQLPADRRAQVLAVLDSQSSSQPDKVALANESKPKRWRMSAAQIAVIALSACVLMGLMLPAVQSARESARRVALLGRRVQQKGIATQNYDLFLPSMTGGTSSAFEPTESSPNTNTTFERRPDNGMIAGGGGRSGRGFARDVEPNSPSLPSADSLAAGNDKPSNSEDFIAEKPLGVFGATAENEPALVNSRQDVGDSAGAEAFGRMDVDAIRSLTDNSPGKPGDHGMGNGSPGEPAKADGNAAVANTNSGESLSIVVAGQTLPSPYYLYDDVQYFPEGSENKLANETAAAKKARAESGKGVADNMRWSDGGVATSLSDTVEAPRPVEQPNTVNVPSRDFGIVEETKTGRILLGGIIHTNESVDGKGSEGKAAEANGPAVDNGRLNSNTWDRGDPSAWMMTVTPPVVVQQEEDEGRYTDDVKGYRQVPEPVAAQNATQSAGASQGKNRGEIDQQVASLVETYNDLMDKKSYAEAEILAKQVNLLEPDSPTSRLLSANASNARRNMENAAENERKEEGFIAALNSVDYAATPIDESAIHYPNTNTWEALSNRRKEHSVDAGKHLRESETTGFDTLQSLVEKSIDPESWIEAGGTNTPNAYPSTLSAATSAPADRYAEASKDVSPEVLGDGSSFMKWVTPKDQPADEDGDSLLGNGQVDFKELSDSSEKDSKKFSVGGKPASEGVAKNYINPREGQVIDLRELENSERRLKASEVIEKLKEPIPADAEVPKIEVRRPNEEELREFEGEMKLGKEVTPNGASVPGLRQSISSRERPRKDGQSQSAKSDAKTINAEANASKLERTLEETSKELSLAQAARTNAIAPSPEAASAVRGSVTLGGTQAPQKQATAIAEQSANSEPFSTFSLHVSDVAFKLAQTALSQGQWPDAAKIRIEEFVNALDYHDPLPTGDQKVACRVEQAIHPFMMQRNLLRVSMRTAATGRSQNTPLRLTLLLDNSGSMERPDRRQAVLRAFQALIQQLSDKDQITLISFASTPRLLADKVAGNQGETLLQLVENLPSEGGTNIEAALMLAREKATEQQVAGAQNRIVLLTDGAVNLGNADPESLAKLVTGMRDAGIAFDAAGISAQDLNDEVLEALTRQGDGRYYLLDSAESIGEKFAAQIAGALRPSAQNVKVQVEFNPQRVGRYKLLGFEKHRLNKEDFRNDKVDAAEMAAAEAGVAVYQYEIKPNGTGDVGSVSVRFRDVSTGKMIENRWPIPYESSSPRLEQAEPSMQLAASAALLAAKLSGGPLGDSVDLTLLQKMLAKLPEQCTSQPRVQQLRTMIEQAIAIAK